VNWNFSIVDTVAEQPRGVGPEALLVLPITEGCLAAETNNFLVRSEHGDGIDHHVVIFVVRDVLAIPEIVELQHNIIGGVVHEDTTDEVPVSVLPGDTNFGDVVRNHVLSREVSIAEAFIVAAKVEVEP